MPEFLLRSKAIYSSISTLLFPFRTSLIFSSPRDISVNNFSAVRHMTSSDRAFQLRVDPLTGDSEWVVVQQDDNLETTESPLAATSYLDMLNDRRRNAAFRLAIDKTLAGAACHVLDIGAGTGLLSMLAARAMCQEGTISACETFLPMGKLLRKVLRDNQMDNRVKVFHKRSDELHVGLDLKSRADVLVSEILDSELLGEGLIPTLQHAHDMLLVEKPKTVPFRATTYGQLVECQFLWRLHDLHSSEEVVSDGVRLAPAGLEGIVGVKPVQYAVHCNALSNELRLLSEPFKIFEFDFSKRPESHGVKELQIKAIDDGNIHAVISWWVLQLDYEGSVFYSTAPEWISSHSTPEMSKNIPDKDEVWCDHWKQCVWFTVGKGISICKNEEVLFRAVHDDISMSYALHDDGQRASHGSMDRHSALLLAPERIATYGDKSWRSTMSIAIKAALQSRPAPLCLVTDDSIFLTILAVVQSENSSVVSFFPGLKEKAVSFLQAIAEKNHFSMNRVKVLGTRASSFDKADINHRKVDLLLGEPFYYGSEGVLPWQNLRFWKERTLLDSVLSEDAVIMPCKGILKVCAMYLPDLWRSRCSLKSVEGFDHSSVNEALGACGDMPLFSEGPCLPYYIWQCGEIRELSDVFSIMEFNFRSHIHPCSGKAKIGFSKQGVCHGFVLWIDWVMNDKKDIVISTGPDNRYWKQGVKLLRIPVNVDETLSSEIEASFEPLTGELKIKYSFPTF